MVVDHWCVKVNGALVALAWTEHAARKKGLFFAMSQAELPVIDRGLVQVWQGRQLVTEYGPVYSSKDDENE